jgi:cell division protein FtsW
VACFVASQIHYTVWRKYAPHLFALGVIVSLLVFVPGIGLSLKGATRWIDLGFVTFQPSELLKLTTIIGAAAALSYFVKRIQVSTLYSVGGFFAIMALPALVLLFQPDIDVLLLLSTTVALLFFVARMRYSDAGILIGIGCILFTFVLFTQPHAQERVRTYLNPSSDILGSGYQIRQSIIAVGSGGMFGRGFGQSIQKFGYLPEPIGDSIFAVMAEEFGFIGSLILLSLYSALAWKGLRISRIAPDIFAALLALGITLLITFLNMSSILGILPLSGNPLVFISHGGTALLIALFSVGILINISRYAK